MEIFQSFLLYRSNKYSTESSLCFPNSHSIPHFVPDPPISQNERKEDTRVSAHKSSSTFYRIPSQQPFCKVEGINDPSHKSLGFSAEDISWNLIEEEIERARVLQCYIPQKALLSTPRIQPGLFSRNPFGKAHGCYVTTK